MKVFISETDRQKAFRVALLNLARFFEILECEDYNNQELYNILRGLNPPIFVLLRNYLTAYNEWFNFYQRIKNDNFKQEYDLPLNDFEKAELTGLINNRQNTLEALQREFDKLQFEKFKRLHGLEDVKGIDL